MEQGEASGLLGALITSFADAPDPASVLERLAGGLVGRLADRVVVDLVEEPDLVTRVAALGPGSRSLLRPGELLRRSSARHGGLLAQLVPTPHRTLRLDASALERLASGPDPVARRQAELARSLGASALVVVGLVVRGRLSGVLTLASTAGPFPPAALAALSPVVALAAMALDAARVREVQRGLATAMQTSLLPPLPALPGLVLAARYAPAGSGIGVGGDWYDAFALPGGAVGLVIGDATGHDTAAISHMAELRHVLRALALDRDEPPGATLARLDRTIAGLGVDASATCLYARLEPAATGELRLAWSSAGHLPPLLRDGSSTRVLDTAPDLMLGVDPDSERTEHHVVVAPGDLLLLCTDGLVEERRTDLDVSLAALAAALQEAPERDLETLVDRMIARRSTTEDDAALLAVRID